MVKQRPSPEKLLQRVQEEERKEQNGKLKIYLGAAPGVGKTYAMLHDALAQRGQGLDVVVGIVESHGRQEIEALLKDLEILPRQKIPYHEQQLLEFDLDAALKRTPGIILVDEMAHTNVPNLRHTKRWQDIKELLDRGIDVYTTLNVQHIESLNDVVSQIIHTRVKETVPDSMLELANTIELIDLSPEDLLKRLQEGKVYFPQQVELATEHFFRKGNLSALRELALRVTAERVGEQVLLYRQGQGIKHIWPSQEKILVCVGPQVEANKLIRAARRMATNLKAEWYAIYVDTPKLSTSEENRNRAIQNLRLAEQLGADTKILTGMDIVKEIINFCREQNITRIVMGKRIRSRWRYLLFDRLTDKLLRNSGEIDVFMITDVPSGIKPPKSIPSKHPIPWGVYGIALGIVALTTIINLALIPHIHTSNIIMMYLLGVIIVALFGRIGPSILASILSVLAYDFFFIPPFFHIFATDTQNIFTLIVMLLVTQIISQLTIITRRQAEAAHLAEQRTATLHSLSRQLAGTRGFDKLIEIAIRYIAQVFDSEVMVLLPENSHLTIRSSYGIKQQLNDKELSVAQWVYDLGQIAGLGTDTLPFSDAVYVPLLTSQHPIGVLRLHPIQPDRLLVPEQMHLLEACVTQIALALEVDRLHEKTKQSELQMATDRVRGALLKSVSHDLRTPLVRVMGSASTLMELGSELNAHNIKKLGKEIYLELEQLNRLINNLLQITYLESESIKLQKELYSLSDVIHMVLQTSSSKLGKKPVHILLAEGLPKIPLDNTLIQEVFINLLDNAIKFTPEKSPIEIFADVKFNKVLISIEDRGPGIVPDEVNKLFEKFYRGRMLTTERGLGLGLAICHSIIKAHGGDIWAENRVDGGAAFRFTLPLD